VHHGTFCGAALPSRFRSKVDYEATALGHELIIKIPTFFELVYGNGRGIHSCTTEL
jgi:hypothetical protein